MKIIKKKSFEREIPCDGDQQGFFDQIQFGYYKNVLPLLSNTWAYNL